MPKPTTAPPLEGELIPTGNSSESTSPPAPKRRGNIANLRPWQPGQSGNPSGRGKTLVGLVKQQTRNGEDLIAALVAIVRDGNARDSDRIAAIKELLDRGFGKAPAITEISGPGGGPITSAHLEVHAMLHSLPISDLEQLGRILAAAQPQLEAPEE